MFRKLLVTFNQNTKIYVTANSFRKGPAGVASSVSKMGIASAFPSCAHTHLYTTDSHVGPIWDRYFVLSGLVLVCWDDSRHCLPDARSFHIT